MPEGKTAEDWVRAWLESSGTALELRTARAFRRVSREVHHSRYYVADDGKTLRESDVIAVVRGDPGSVILNFVIECKSVDKPWVLYERDRMKFGRRDEDIIETLEVREVAGATVGDLNRLYAAPLLHANELGAYQIADTYSKDNSDAYNAVRQVMDGVDGLARDLRPRDVPAVFIFVPVLVTTAPLFKVSLDDEGEPSVEAVDRMLLTARQRTDDQPRSIWVLRESALESFVDDALESANAVTW